MRTFPKSLAAFRKVVKERGENLRGRSFEELKHLTAEPIEHVTVEARPATIAIIVLSLPSGGLQVVVQGFLEHRFMPGKSVALDGFYIYPDEMVCPMKDEEFWEFD